MRNNLYRDCRNDGGRRGKVICNLCSKYPAERAVTRRAGECQYSPSNKIGVKVVTRWE